MKPRDALKATATGNAQKLEPGLVDKTPEAKQVVKTQRRKNI